METSTMMMVVNSHDDPEMDEIQSINSRTILKHSKQTKKTMDYKNNNQKDWKQQASKRLTENDRKHIILEALQNSRFVDNESVAQEILGSLNQPVFRGLSAVAFRELDESVIASHPGEALPADRFSSTTEQPNQPTVQPNQLTTIAGPTNAPRDPPMVEVQPGSSHTENRSSLSGSYSLISTSTDSRSYAFVNPFADTEENLPQQRPTRATLNPDSSPYDADTDTSKPKSRESKLDRSKSI